MANPITWRQMATPSQRDAISLFEQGGQQVNRGLNNLANIAQSQANQMDADQLNAALAQVNNLGTVDAARAARENNMVGGLGLNPEMQNQVRDALRSRINALQQQNITQQNYDTNQRSRTEAPIRDQIARLADSGDFTQARQLAEGLSDGGRVLAGLTEAERGYNARNTLENFRTTLQGVPAAREQYRQQQQEFLARNPGIADAIRFDPQGRMQVNTDSGYTQEFVGNLMREQGYDFTGGIPTYDQAIGNLYQNADGLSFNQLAQAIQGAEGIRNSDPAYQQEQAVAARQAELNQQIQDIRQEAFLAQNPTNPILPPSSYSSRNDFYKEVVLPLSEGKLWNNGDDVTKKIDKVVDKKFTMPDGSKVDYPLNVIQDAFFSVGEVQEAQTEHGGLDSIGDTFDEEEFETNLRASMARDLQNRNAISNNAFIREQFLRNGANPLTTAPNQGFTYGSLSQSVNTPAQQSVGGNLDPYLVQQLAGYLNN